MELKIFKMKKKNKDLLKTKKNFQIQKASTFWLQNGDLWSISKGEKWNFTEEPFKFWKNVWQHQWRTEASN